MSERKPKISIILSSYNHERFIGQTIESVLAQTHTDFELLIADDASTDGSWEVIQSYTDPRIKARREPVNKNGTAREEVRRAIGEYMAIHHSGDLWLPDKLQKQLEWLESHPEHVAVFTHVQGISESGAPVEDDLIKKFRQPNRTRHEWLNYFFYKWNALCHPSVLMRMEHARKIYTLYGPTTINDWGMWIRTCCEHDIHIIQEPLTIFQRMHGDASAGGRTEENSARVQLEALRVLHYFRGIGTVDDWLGAFPEVKQYRMNGELVPEYALARMCLSRPPSEGPCFTLFGILLLFELLANEETRLKLDRLYRFGPKELRAITGAWRLGMAERAKEANTHTAYAQLLFANGVQSKPIESTYTIRVDGGYEVVFDLREELQKMPKIAVTHLNFLPKLGQPCRHTLLSCWADAAPVALTPMNSQGISQAGEDVFSAITPLYQGAAPLPRVLTLTITGCLRLFSREEMMNIYATMEQENRDLRTKLAAVTKV